MEHEIKGGGVRMPANGKTYQMYLTIDGQKRFKGTGTADLEGAQDKLKEWETQEKLGYKSTNGLRYEEIRDDYLASGKNLGHVPKGGVSAIQRDLDTFFKNIRVAAIGVKLTEFRKWRESQTHVLESKAETLQKEIALRTMKAMNGRRKPLTDAEKSKIEKEATDWVENGVKATTDKRLKYLRAIFYHAFKKTQKITKGDIPHFPVLGTKVDNVKQGKFTDADLQNLLNELPAYKDLIKFLAFTGMRSGQAKAITWDMIHDNTLTMPGFLTKNKKPYSLTLVDENGKPYEATKFLVVTKDRPHGSPVFDVTNFRQEWRQACAKLKLGVFDSATRSYRGAMPHDFRRTAATNMIVNRKASETAAMSVTGHKTSSVFKRYAIENPDLQRSALG